MGENSNQLCLKWNHFEENFTSQFGSLKEEKQFVDVTLSCQSRLLRAHKVVLSASSPYLTQLFKDNPCKHAVIILDDVPFSHLEALLCFIYTGAASIAESELPAFLDSASVLQIRGLTDTPTPVSQKSSGRSAASSPAESGSRKRTGDFTATYTSPKKLQLVNKCDSNTSFVSPEEEVCSEDVESRLGPSGDASGNSALANQDLTKTKVKSEPGGLESVTSVGIDESATLAVLQQPQVAEGDYASVDGRRRHSLDPRPCPLCNRLYSNLSNLRQHVRLIHNPTVVTCKLCMKTFKTDLYLRRHLISYHDMNLSMEQGAIPDLKPPLTLLTQ